MHGYNMVAQIYYPRYVDGNVAGIVGPNFCPGYIYMVECSIHYRC